jgi:hypothetical protein
LRDNNPETQHTQLVTATEVIIAEKDRPQPIIDALGNLLSEVENWPESQADVKKRLTEILQSSKEESISRAGAEQIGEMLEGKYAEKTPAAFFKRVYDMRSRLVHREKRRRRRPTHDDLRNVHMELCRFVLDLLDAYESG